MHGVSENLDLGLPLSLKNCKGDLFRENESITNPLLDFKHERLDETNLSHTSNKDSSFFEINASFALALKSIMLSYRLVESSNKIMRGKSGVNLN